MIDTRFACARLHNSNLSLADAIARDERDKCKLNAIGDSLLRFLDEMLPYIEPLEHPMAGWHPEDLLNAITEQAKAIRHEMRHYRGPVVVEAA